jgi:hypothetical protein
MTEPLLEGGCSSTHICYNKSGFNISMIKFTKNFKLLYNILYRCLEMFDVVEKGMSAFKYK